MENSKLVGLCFSIIGEVLFAVALFGVLCVDYQKENLHQSLLCQSVMEEFINMSIDVLGILYDLTSLFLVFSLGSILYCIFLKGLKTPTLSCFNRE